MLRPAWLPGCGGALAFQFFRQGGGQAGGLLRLLERLVQFLQLGLERVAAVLGPAVELVHLGVEPVAVPGGQRLEKLLAAARHGFVQGRCDRCGHLARAALAARQVEEPPALGFVQERAVVGQAGQDQQVLRLQGAHGEASARQPAALAHQRLQDGDVLAAAGVVEDHFGGRRGQALPRSSTRWASGWPTR